MKKEQEESLYLYFYLSKLSHLLVRIHIPVHFPTFSTYFDISQISQEKDEKGKIRQVCYVM